MWCVMMRAYVNIYVMIIAVITFIWLGVVAITRRSYDCRTTHTNTPYSFVCCGSQSVDQKCSIFTFGINYIVNSFVICRNVCISYALSLCVRCVDSWLLRCQFDTVQHRKIQFRFGLICYTLNYCHNNDNSSFYLLFELCLVFLSLQLFSAVLFFFYYYFSYKCNRIFTVIVIGVGIVGWLYRAIFSAQFLSHYILFSSLLCSTWTGAYFANHCLYEPH